MLIPAPGGGNMTIHNCISWPCPTCTTGVSGIVTTTTGTVWNGGACGVCGALYLGSHTCSVEDLMRRSDELRDMAMEKFRALRPEPTRGPVDRTTGCPCRPENGGSGVCGCILGGPQITC